MVCVRAWYRLLLVKVHQHPVLMVHFSLSDGSVVQYSSHTVKKKSVTKTDLYFQNKGDLRSELH